MNAAAAVEQAYRLNGRRVIATLIRLLGSFDAAEEALHEALAAALDQWPRHGVPENPYAWLVSTARFRAADRARKRARERGVGDALVQLETPELALPDAVPDDELRLIFVCCHPVLTPDARVALALRELCGLRTEEIARAYLVPAPTIAQRIVRAKQKIRADHVPYELPTRGELPARLSSVLQVIYLIFNEGYAATQGPDLMRSDLCDAALRLARLVVALLDDAEARGLLALLLLHEARRATRVDAQGALILLEAQDRSRWDQSAIAEAQTLIESALQSRHFGPYTLQAAIAAVHAEAASFAATDWTQIIALYDVLARCDRSPVIALNRAVAVAMRDGAERGLAEIDAVIATGTLDAYAHAHAARADMLRRLQRDEEARAAYAQAIALTRQAAERSFLEGRMAALAGSARVPQGAENGRP